MKERRGEEKIGIKEPHGATLQVSGTLICHYIGMHVFFHKKVFCPSAEAFLAFS